MDGKFKKHSVEESYDKVVDYLSSLDNHNKFMDEMMVNIISERDSFIINEIGKACISIGVHVDEKRLKRWIEMCTELDNIPIGLQQDLAFKNRFNILENENRNLYHENRLLKHKLKKLEDALLEK